MDKITRTIDVLMFPDMNLLDVAGPVQAFSIARQYGGFHYDLRYVSLNGKAVTSTCGLRVMPDEKANNQSTADDLLIPGGQGVDQLLNNRLLHTFIGDWGQNKKQGRVIAICSGALLAASAGVLDGKRATTHWERTAQAQKLFPQVSWRMNDLYVKDNNVFTSAGVTAGIDLALAIVRMDSGPVTALGIAREMVVYLQRAGGQSQFSELLEAQYAVSNGLQQLINQLLQAPAKQWSLQSMAETMSTTPRTLSRRFATELNDSPIRFLEKIRVKFASDAISSGMPLTTAINRFGFGDFQHLQRAFKRTLGTTVGEFQKRFSAPKSELI